MSKIEIENINTPGRISRVDAEKYGAMRTALMAVLPIEPPGMTFDEMKRAVVAHLPEALFPGGAKAGWWCKSVQLDLEAKGLVMRSETKPLRFRRADG